MMRKFGIFLAVFGVLALVLLAASPARAADVIIEHPDPGTTASANESVYGSVSEAPTAVVVKYSNGGAWQTACNANIDALTWDCVWNTASLASGTYTIRADATIGGVVSSSGTVSIVVSNASSGSSATPTPANTSSSSTKPKTSATPPATSASVSASPTASVTPMASTTDDTAKSNTTLYIIIGAAVVVIGGGATYLILRARKKTPTA